MVLSAPQQGLQGVGGPPRAASRLLLRACMCVVSVQSTAGLCGRMACAALSPTTHPLQKEPLETLKGGGQVVFQMEEAAATGSAPGGWGRGGMQGGDGRWWGEALPRLLSPSSVPTPTPLQAPRSLGFAFHFCSSSMVVNGHCSMEKDKNVFSLEALFRTFSPWAKGLGWEASPWQSGPRQGGVPLDVGGAAGRRR